MPATKKLDLYKLHKAEYLMPREPALVSVKPAKYLTIHGQGAPTGTEFQRKIRALYGVAYTLKMTKKLQGKDYRVCHLEGLWWGPHSEEDFASVDPETWNWTLLMRIPEFVQNRDLAQAVAQLQAKGKGEETAGVKLEKISEGRCLQVLHIGPYSNEAATVGRMMEYARQQGLAFRGKHHEIYLSDPRRVPPERLKTILRHPVATKH